jgi:uncharacterized protein
VTVRCVEITSGDVLAGLRDWCADAGPAYRYSAIVSIVGAVDTFMVSGNDADGNQAVCDGKTAEMSGTGEIRGGMPHVHAVFGVSGGGQVACGHLEAAQVAADYFVRVYVAPFEVTP